MVTAAASDLHPRTSSIADSLNSPGLAYAAPWYAGHWDASWPDTEPRPVAWNCSAESRADHHGNIATEDMISEPESVVITGVFKNRWRTLMSVDDVIGEVIAACEELKVADNTFFFYTSGATPPFCRSAIAALLFTFSTLRPHCWCCLPQTTDFNSGSST